MGKSGFATILLLVLFLISYSLFPLVPGINTTLTPIQLLNNRPGEYEQKYPSLGIPQTMWNNTYFDYDNEYADVWDIIQFESTHSLYPYQLAIVGSFTYGEYGPFYGRYQMPIDQEAPAWGGGWGWLNTTIMEGHSIIQDSEGNHVSVGVSDGIDGKKKLVIDSDLFDMYFNASISDEGWSIIEYYPRAFVIAGVTESYGAGKKDVWLLHTDPNHWATGGWLNYTSMIWNCTFGGSGDDEGRCVVNCSAGGFVVAGFTNSFGAGGFDGWLIRTDTDGNQLWNRTFGSSRDDRLYSVIECQSGGFAMIGTSELEYHSTVYTAMWVIRTNENGDILWERFLGAPIISCRGYDLVELEDGTFAFAGSIKHDSFDMLLVRFAADGTNLSYQTFGGLLDDEAHAITTVISGGVALAGYTESFGEANRSGWVVRVPEDYQPVWDKNQSSHTIMYNSSFHYRLSASDPSGIDRWWINNSVDFTISNQGLITNRRPLAVKTYSLMVYVSDVWGNTASKIFNVNVLPLVPEPIPMWPTFLLTLIVILILSSPFIIYSYLKQRRTE